MIGPSTGEDRAVSQTASHIFAIGVTAILISVLMFTANAVYQDERDQAAQEQLRIIGNRIAEELSRASRLAQEGANVSIDSSYQSEVSGQSYTVSLLTGSSCDTDQFTTDTCLRLALSQSDVTVKVPVENESAVSLKAYGDGAVSITANTSRTSPIQSDPPVNIQRRIGVGSDVPIYKSGASVNITNRKPFSGFTFTPGQPTVDSIIHFESDADDLDGVIEEYEWDLGDGTTKTGVKEFNHSYAEPGKYTVTLTVTDDDGDTDSVSKIVTVSGLVYNENSDEAGDVESGTVDDGRVNFTVTNKHDEQVELLELLVDPDNESIDYITEDNLTAASEIEIDGNADDYTEDNEVQIFDSGTIKVLADEGSNEDTDIDSGSTAEIEFNGLGPDDSADGDRTDMQDEEVFVALHYGVDGEFYSTQFTVFGDTTSNDAPDPSFTANCPDLDCSFDASGSSDDGSITDYEWEFGDGDTATGETSTHTYAEAGEYSVSLTVTDDDDVTSTLTKTVRVGSGSQWYDHNWNKRKPITIDHRHVAGDLSNFPVAINLTDADLAAKAQSDGDDILFTMGDGVTKLNHEIESFDSGTGELIAWVNVTELPGDRNTTLYMYYDNSAASNQEDVTQTWPGKYEMVQHLEESSGSATDSTANGNDGTVNGPSYGQDGRLDGAYGFGGSQDSVEVPDSINDGPFTIQVWFKPSSTSWEATLFDATDSPIYFFVGASDSEVAWCFESEDDSDVTISPAATLDAKQWHQISVTGKFSSNGPHELYLDGSLEGDSERGLNVKGSLATPLLGEETNNYDGGCGMGKSEFDGTMDEVRIVSERLSDEWIETEFNNQDPASDFYTVGDEQALFLETSGEVVMEAENAMATEPGNDADIGPSNGDDMSDTSWVEFSDSDASGSTALEGRPTGPQVSSLDTENGERLDYFVNVTTPGTYDVYVRLNCSNTTANDAIHVGVNGSVGTYGANGMNASSSDQCGDTDGWLWVSRADGSQVQVDFPSATQYAFNVWMYDDGVVIDKIVLKQGGSAPTGTGPAESPTS